MDDPQAEPGWQDGTGARRRVWSGLGGERARDAFTAWTRKPTLGEKVIGLFFAALMVGLLLLILIPALVLGLVALTAGAVALGARRGWRKLTGGRAVRDERKNVRVIVRRERA